MGWNGVSTGSAYCKPGIISVLSSYGVMFIYSDKTGLNYVPLPLCGSKPFSVVLNDASCVGCTMT